MFYEIVVQVIFLPNYWRTDFPSGCLGGIRLWRWNRRLQSMYSLRACVRI